MLAGGALVVLLVTGLYQFYTVVPQAVQDEMTEFRFGTIFITKMTLFVVLLALIAAHAAWLGPRIQRALDAAGDATGGATADSAPPAPPLPVEPPPPLRRGRPSPDATIAKALGWGLTSILILKSGGLRSCSVTL